MRVAFALCLLLVASVAFAGDPTFAVKYRSTGYVYLDGGRSQGLSVGDRLNVLQGADTIGELEVVFLADQSASCRVVSEKRTLRAGDTVILVRPPSTSAPTPAAVPSGPAGVPASTGILSPQTNLSKKPETPFFRARGGLSLGYYRVQDQTATAYDFEQRTGRADISLWDLGGKPLSLDVRFRSRQDVRTQRLSARSEKIRSDRLYEASLRYEPPSDSFAFELGRLGSSRFLSIGYLDGGLFRVRVAPVLQVGGFAGRRSEFDVLGLEGSGTSYGGFLRIAPPGRYTTTYEAIVAYIRENARNEVSREYASLETRYQPGRRFSLYQRAEVDLNRGWRGDVTEQPYQLSYLSVSANMRLAQTASAVLSYDSRRNYRDFYTRNVPENVFDNLLHQGFHLGFYEGQAYGLTFTGNVGVRLKDQESHNAYSFNAGARHGNVWGKNASLGFDVSGFSNGFTNGYLITGGLGKRLGRGHMLDLSYSRSLYQVRETGDRRTTAWLRLVGRGELGRHVYALGDLEYDRGDDLKGPRGYFELGYQF